MHEAEKEAKRYLQAPLRLRAIYIIHLFNSWSIILPPKAGQSQSKEHGKSGWVVWLSTPGTDDDTKPQHIEMGLPLSHPFFAFQAIHLTFGLTITREKAAFTALSRMMDAFGKTFAFRNATLLCFGMMNHRSCSVGEPVLTPCLSTKMSERRETDEANRQVILVGKK